MCTRRNRLGVTGIGATKRHVKTVPREAAPRELRSSLMALLERVQFSAQIRRPARSHLDEKRVAARDA